MKKIIFLIYLVLLIPLFFTDIKSMPKEALYPYTNLVLVNKDYYLNESYIPKNLVLMKDCLVSKEIYIEKECYYNYLKLVNLAKLENIFLICYSGYRSYNYQDYIFIDELYQAKPGYSEHQTGLALDVTIDKVGLIKELEEYPAYDFLINNMHQFGFILRYPKDKENITKYPFEPWHIRYVGKKIAFEINQNNWCLEEYYLKKGLM